MQEYRVTVGGKTYPLQQPFFVLATQNPIEQEGTYPLPEAQLDRFMFNILIDYPERADEIAIIKATTVDEMPEVSPVMDGRSSARCSRSCAACRSATTCWSTWPIWCARRGPTARRRPSSSRTSRMGRRPARGPVPGPRRQGRAVLDGRLNVSCNDVRSIARPVLRHRIFTNFNADSEGLTVEDVVTHLLDTVQEPDEKAYAEKAKRGKATE